MLHLDNLQKLAAKAVDAGFSFKVLAGHYGVTERHFRRCIQSKFGMRPRLWMTVLRLRKMRQALSQDVPIKAIAAEVAFSDAANLAHYCQRYYKVTPSSLRTHKTRCRNRTGKHRDALKQLLVPPRLS